VLCQDRWLLLFACAKLCFVVGTRGSLSGFSAVRSAGAVNGNDALSDQKISKFFVSHVEESMAGHVGVTEFIKS
jgi:hypothetical protein